ncbi:MAG: 2OG-Fe(II) oxygenase [Nanoarchaeota archaeon]|nr:2OG-Fe(II) oxygenase [Nanoarchaeota archaeon]
MLDLWINKNYLKEDKINELKEIFLKAEPFQHLSLNNFLNEEKAEKLLKEIKKEEYYKEENDLYSFKRTIDFRNSKSKLILEFRQFLLSSEARIFFESFLGKDINNKKIDLHSLKLENTDYLLCHDDEVEGRYFAFIFNLSKDFDSVYDGGELELFNEKNMEAKEVVKKINPKFNQFNVFKVSKKSFHQVSEVLSDKERISISGWFYKK